MQHLIVVSLQGVELEMAMLKIRWILAGSMWLAAQTSALAIESNYAKKLERSGCTQLSELQGCDINKSKAENSVSPNKPAAPERNSQDAQTPYAGNWVAVGPSGGIVAKIRIDSRERVMVNGKRVKAKRSDGALVFKQGFITYVIQGDRRLKGEDTWKDSDAGSTGNILSE